jgi:hypothetical protein
MNDKYMNINNSDCKGNFIQGDVGGKVVYDGSKEEKTPAEAAKEIQQLLDQLSQSYPTTTTPEKIIFAQKAMEEIDKKSDTKDKIIKALKAGGIASITELTNHPVVRILTPMLESLLEDHK